MIENYDFFLRIGVDGEREVGKSCLIKKFASDDFYEGKYKNVFHAYVTTTHIRLDGYDIKIEFLETGWDLRPNENYYKYIDGAILVYDISPYRYDGLKELKELSREYSRIEIPIMIVANKCDKNEHKNRDDLLKEVKNYFGEELNILGEEFLFDKTSEKEKTNASLNKILKKCIFRLLDFKGINDLNKLTSPNNQFKSVMNHATQLYLYEVPKKVIDGRQQIEEILHGGIEEFLSLERVDMEEGEGYGGGYYYGYYGYCGYYGHKDIIKKGVYKKNDDKHVIIATNEYEIPKVFQKQLENAIDEMKKLLEKLEHQEDKVYFQKFLQKIPEILEHQEDKVYFQKYCEKINNQLNHFKDFEKKALKISDFSYMINSTFEILSGLALLRTKSFLSIEELNIIDLENTQQDEINLSLDKTKEDLSKWINYCSEITDQFRNFDKDYTNLMNIEDHLFFFEIQEDILIKIDNIKTNLLHNSKEIDKPKVRRLFSSSSTEMKKKAHSKFLLIIGLKFVYDLTIELENTASKLKFLDLKFFQKISEFLETLSKELSKLEIAKNFEKYELYIKEFYLDYIVEHLTKISCLVNDFCRQIVFERFLKTENYY